MPNFTISEIAERIRKPGEEVGAVIDRLKNWVKEGLLQPIGEKNPGTGRHRLFPESALIDALVLHVLTDQIGMQAVKARAFSKLFSHARKSFKKPDAARFVTIGRSADNRAAEIGFAHAEGLAELLIGSPHAHESHVVINLQQLFKRLEG
jgi:hypothetical protein